MLVDVSLVLVLLRLHLLPLLLVEGPVVVVPTPTGPAARLLSSRLAMCAISLRTSGSDVGGHVIYL